MREYELKDYGPTPGCPGCDAYIVGGPRVGHNTVCRERITNVVKTTEAGAARVAAADQRMKRSAGATLEASPPSRSTRVKHDQAAEPPCGTAASGRLQGSQKRATSDDNHSDGERLGPAPTPSSTSAVKRQSADNEVTAEGGE